MKTLQEFDAQLNRFWGVVGRVALGLAFLTLVVASFDIVRRLISLGIQGWSSMP